MSNEIDFTGKTVYLAAPKRILRTDLYDKAFRYMLARAKGVMNPLWMFNSNADWQENYQEALKVCDIMVIVSDDDLVGKGVFLEYNEFFHRHCKIYFYLDEDGYEELCEVIRLKVIDDNDWKNYAYVEYKVT